MGTVSKIKVWRNVVMELKRTYHRNDKTRRRTKKHERRNTAGYASFSSSITSLSCVAAVTNALIRYLAEFRGAFMCVWMCSGGLRGRETVKQRWGSVRKPFTGYSLAHCGVICRVGESQTHARTRSLFSFFDKQKVWSPIRACGGTWILNTKGTFLQQPSFGRSFSQN